MKVMTLYLVVVVTCLGTLTVAVAQALAESGKPLTESLPPEVCKGIEAYVARIDTAKSMREPSKRAELYTAAKADLEPVMKQYNKTSLLADASTYASYTEEVATRDATDPKLNEFLEKRSKLRDNLLGICTSYTISR